MPFSTLGYMAFFAFGFPFILIGLLNGMTTPETPLEYVMMFRGLAVGIGFGAAIGTFFGLILGRDYANCKRSR